MHYAATDAIVADIADEMDLSSMRAVELLDHVVELDGLDESFPLLETEMTEWNELFEGDDTEWTDDVDFEIL